MQLLANITEFANLANLPESVVSANSSTYVGFISAAESMLLQHCNSILSPSETPVYVYGNGEEYLRLPVHIRELSGFHRVGEAGGSDTDLTSSVMLGDPLGSVKSYVYDDARNQMYFMLHAKIDNGLFFYPGVKYKVSGKFGPSDIPAAVKLAVALLVKHMVKLSNVEPGVKQVAVEGKTVQYGRAQAVPALVHDLVKDWIIPVRSI